jgi:Fic family protein
MKSIKGGNVDVNNVQCTATVLNYRTGDQFETPWNIKRQGLMKFADWTFPKRIVECDGAEALNNAEQQLVSCTCN